MQYQIAYINGDGIGAELMQESALLLEKVGAVYGHTFKLTEAFAGDNAYERFGDVFSEESADICRKADGILMGGFKKIDKKYQDLPKEKRPNTLGTMLKKLCYETNVRPVRIYPGLEGRSSLRADIAEKGMDIVVMRDLMGGMTKSKHYTGTCEFGRDACDYEYYHEQMIRPTVINAFEYAMRRSRKLCHACKKVGTRSALLWVDIVNEVKADYPEVALEHVNADDCAMLLVRDPSDFDVIVGANTYCDILSDEIAGIMGIPRMLAGANLMPGGKGLFERNLFTEVAENEVGEDTYNPIGILSAVSLLLKHALKLEKESDAVELAITETLQAGYATRDFCRCGSIPIGMRRMGKEIRDRIR